MSFTSVTFWSFFLSVFVLYWVTPQRRLQNILLLVASYVFYGWIHPWLALLLGASTLADFFLAKRMHLQTERPAKRPFLIFSLLINLGVLGFFKYYNFFSDDLAEIVTALGLQSDVLLTKVLFPAGLSFYTLKKLAYMIDVSRGTLQPTDSLINFALYVAFFPQLVAGPIDRPQKLLPQIETQRRWSSTYFYSAWPLLLMGLFKKLVIADSIGLITQRIFHLEEPTLLLAVSGAFGFTLQILADFSAYTDLSRGTAFLLGFETSENFRSPYLSLTPTEFWNRWHITLSNWLRDYVFFPLRRFLLSRQRQLPPWLVQSIPPLVTMLISGIWHGAGWTYFLWGGLYGLLIVLYQAIGMGGNWKPKSTVQALFAWMVMFSFIVFGWMLFAAPSLAWVTRAFSQGMGSLEQQGVALIALSMTAVYSIPLIAKLLIDRISNEDSLLRSLYYAAATAAIFLYINSSNPDFIYFQF